MHLNRDGAPFAAISRTTYLYLYIGNGEPVYGAAPVNHYESLGTTRIEREARARELVFDAIAKRLPAWPFEKLASELPNFLTPSSFAVRRLLMPEDHRFRLNRPWAYRLAWEHERSDAVRVALVGVVVAAYVATVLVGVLGLALAPPSALRQLSTLFLLSQVAPTLLTFAISRFRIASMAVLMLSAAWALHRRGDAWRDATLRRRWAAVALVVAVAAGIALRWGQLYGNAWA